MQVTDLLVIQSHGAGNDPFVKWLEITGPIHEKYASACEADYELFVGKKGVRVHPAWNRIPMILDAFEDGYRKVVWLDADTLVIDLDCDIFADTPDDVPLLMRRAPMRWHGEHSWNDGVLVANNTPATILALEWVWDQRFTRWREHHAPSLWELNWLLDYVFDHPDMVGELDERFHRYPFDDELPGSVVLSWHGMPHDDRYRAFSEAVDRWYP